MGARKGGLDAPRPSAFERALGRLARRDHAEQELRGKLARDGYPADEIDAALTRLRDRGYLDDATFAVRFARSRMRHDGLGRHRIRQALRQRGVGRATVESGLALALAEVPEGEQVDVLARRYWRSHAADEPPRRVRKLWAFLLRRGFPADLVQARLRALWPRLGDALAGLEPAEAGMDDDATAFDS